MDAKTKTKVNAIWERMQTKMIELYERWGDEKEHEDWSCYEDYMKKLLCSAAASEGMCVQVVKFYKRPFGIKFTIDGFDGKVQFKVIAGEYSWSRFEKKVSKKNKKEREWKAYMEILDGQEDSIYVNLKHLATNEKVTVHPTDLTGFLTGVTFTQKIVTKSLKLEVQEIIDDLTKKIQEVRSEGLYRMRDGDNYEYHKLKHFRLMAEIKMVRSIYAIIETY